MMLEVFLFQLLRNPELTSVRFWILVFVYAALIAGGLFGKWHLLKKAGRTPWHCLVPFLSSYEIYDLCWDGRFGILYSILAVLIALITPASGRIELYGLRLNLLTVMFFTAAAISVVMKTKLCRSFNRSGVIAYGLIFLEGIFYPLGFRNCIYYGRTLRKYNPKQVREARPHVKPGLSRNYMISLHRARSITALAACILTCGLCFFAVAGGLIEDPSVITPERGNQLFKLFTVNSNFFSAIGAALMIPYAVEGIRRKRFTFPKWIQLIQYSGAICTTLTMIFAVTLIFPALGARIAFGRMNFWLHLVCPVMTLVLLFSVETDLELSLKESIFCLTPFYIYAAVYVTNVVLIGEENGGWRDIYRLATYLPASLSAPMMFMLGFFVAQAIRFFYNRLARSRHQKMQRLWDDDLSPVEIRIEVYGLGRMTGKHDEITNITVPIDIFQDFAARYDVTVDDLIRVFAKGVTDGLKEHNEYNSQLRKSLDLLIGTPQKLREDGGDTEL